MALTSRTSPWLTGLILGVALVWPSPSGAQTRTDYLYATSVTQNGAQWTTAGQARYDPECGNTCTCSPTICAANSQSNGDRKLTAVAFDPAPGDLMTGARWISEVRVNVNGRFTGGSGGTFDIHFIVRDDGGAIAIQEDRLPGNNFASNSLCDWRIPQGSREITSAVDWNLHPQWLNNIELSVWRHLPGNGSTMLVNAFRISVDSVPWNPISTLSTNSLDFGAVAGGDWVEHSFTITNTGGGTLQGAVPHPCCDGAFSVVSGLGEYALTRNQSRQVTVRFACPPCSTQPHFADLVTIGGSVHLQGMGKAVFVTSPAALDLGDVPLGSFADGSFTVTNQRQGPQLFTIGMSWQWCDQAELISGGEIVTLTPGQPWPVTVRFKSQLPGLASFQVAVASSGCGTAVGFTATGVAPSASCIAEPTSVDFGQSLVGDYTDRTILLTNMGGTSLSGVVAQNAPTVTLIGGGGNYSLNPGETHIVTARFIPTEIDTVFGLLTFGYGDGVLLRGESAAVSGLPFAASPPPPALALRVATLESTTSFTLEIPSAGPARLDVFDISGRRIETLFDGNLQAGVHGIEWPISGSRGRLAIGVYFARLWTVTATARSRLLIAR